MPKEFFDQTLDVLSIELNSINALFVNHFYNKQYILKFTIVYYSNVNMSQTDVTKYRRLGIIQDYKK